VESPIIAVASEAPGGGVGCNNADAQGHVVTPDETLRCLGKLRGSLGRMRGHYEVEHGFKPDIQTIVSLTRLSCHSRHSFSLRSIPYVEGMTLGHWTPFRGASDEKVLWLQRSNVHLVPTSLCGMYVQML
jgi:hypothetical protein